MNMEAIPPRELVETWVIGDDYTGELVCETHAREFAQERGLVFEWPNYTEESPNGYAHATLTAGDVESDYPNTCSGYNGTEPCDLYLDSALTLDGEQYVRENYPATWWPLWGVEA
jgi:hypothetical protein